MTAHAISRTDVADALALVAAADADPGGATQMVTAMTPDELAPMCLNLAALVGLARDIGPGMPLDQWSATILRTIAPAG